MIVIRQGEQCSYQFPLCPLVAPRAYALAKSLDQAFYAAGPRFFRYASRTTVIDDGEIRLSVNCSRELRESETDALSMLMRTVANLFQTLELELQEDEVEYDHGSPVG